MKLTFDQKNTIVDDLKSTSVRVLLEEDYFKERITYPNRRNYFVSKTCECCGSKIERDKKTATDEYSRAMQHYRADVAIRREMFKYACFYELDISDTPAAHKAWDIAWDKGHSSGLYAVYQELEELAEILKLINY